MKQARRVYELQLRNLKPIVLKEATEFVKEKAKAITEELSKQHRNICNDFIEYM